ncbi:MAG: methyltransferase, TIGR04325 family [Gammaproteobacteria bacterium]|jgi:putative methyltransferase (TIGR04325 family)|nr:methyltransferase, TIGR04325 family [Gammaproteobacteria bacterium]
MKNFFKAVTPPIIQSQLKELFCKKLGYFSGPYSSWQDALSHAKGYQDPLILERVKNSTLQAMHHKQSFIRDAIVDTKAQHAYPVYSALLKLMIENKGKLTVLDFGGGLGSTFFAFKQFCPKVVDIKWEVIEQPAFVECAKALGMQNEISFHEKIESLQCVPDVILLSATLQYIEKPYELLRNLLALGTTSLIIDRTWFAKHPIDRIIVEHVPKHIYASSYPCWLLSYEKFIKYISEQFTEIHEFDSLEGSFRKNGFNICGKGLFARKEVN